MGNRRVLVLNHYAAPRAQAGGTRHVELFGRLQGWDHLIIASDLNPQSGERIAAEPGLAVVPVTKYSANGMRRILNWLAYACCATFVGLKQPRIDVVYGSSPHLVAALAAWVIATAKRATFVLEVRDLWPQVLVDMGTLKDRSILFRVLTRLELFLCGRAKKIVVMARGAQDSLTRRGVDPHKICYIPNGSDPGDYEPTAPRAELRAKYGFTKFTAVYTGAHGPANGLGALLDAAKQLQDLEVDIVLVGGGVAKQSLVERAQQERLQNVRFLEPVPKTEIPDLLAAADLGLHILADVPLFQRAVSPNKLFDYMAAGLPLLTNCPGLVSELVHEATCGIAVDPLEVATGIRRALELRPRALASLGDSGQTWIAEHQSRTAMSNRLGDALHDAGS